MFERYTEKARRVIFFSRYEASQFGSPYIETEHILLAIVHECRDAMRLFGNTLPLYPVLRKQVEGLYVTKSNPLPASADLPLSNECKRVLAYGAEEAERLHDLHIGAEHLFLGLLREENSLAAQLLQERSITLNGAREKIARDSVNASAGVHKAATDTIIRLHGSSYPANYFQAAINRHIQFAWQKQTWKPRDLLVEKQTRRVMYYAGGTFDALKFELVKGGWKRDHCAVCHWPLYESDDAEHGVAYTNGRDWICTECHDKFFIPPVTPLDDLYT